MMGRLFPPRGRAPTSNVLTFLTIASLLCLQIAPSTSASVPRTRPDFDSASASDFDSDSDPDESISRRLELEPRLNGEHVVLADCTGLNSDFSSQMAYYPGSATGKPVDVGVVPTPDGQYSLWVDTTTSALFTTSGVTFTAVLGPRVADGEYAGSGDNGYGKFSCWAKYKKDLYTWGNTTCSMVYDCDHRDANSTTSDSASASASASPSAAVSATDSASSTTNTALPGSSGGGGELSVGAIVGVSIGAGIGAISLAVGVFFLWRHLRNSDNNNQHSPEGGLAAGAEKNEKGYPPGQYLQQYPPPQELDAQYRGAEVHSNSRKDELDGNPRSELPPPTTPGGSRFYNGPYSPGGGTTPGSAVPTWGGGTGTGTGEQEYQKNNQNEKPAR